MILRYIEKHWQQRSALVAFLTGIGFTTVSYFISSFLFKHTAHLIGITTIFFTVILTMPVLHFILKKEEELEKKKGNFFKKNGKIIDFYVYFFLGVFLTFMIISFTAPSSVFSKEDLYNIQPSDSNIRGPSSTPSNQFLFKQIVINNLYLAGVALIISLFFGAGSIFLLVLNASMAAAFLSTIIRSSNIPFLKSTICHMSLFNIHFLPEMIGVLIAALAGGLLYIDFAKEKLFSKNFDEVLLDAGKLAGLAVVIIVIAAALEVFVSKPLFQSDICTNSSPGIALLLAAIVAIVIFIERVRIKHHKGKLAKK
jgi:uncharacterized membrane protein SpoIIM required for sporulation